ncbi:MAG: hypothetical protein ACM3UN_03800 [Bacillota bacterium]
MRVTKKKIRASIDILLTSEHTILDFDHLLMFLHLISSSPEKESSGIETEGSRTGTLGIAKTGLEMMFRLKVCTFYRQPETLPTPIYLC